MTVLQLGRQYADTTRLEEADALLGSAGHAWHAEDGTDGTANEIGVIQVCQRVADDDGVSMCRICRAQHSPQVARLLDTLQYNILRTLLLRQVGHR